MTKNKNNYKKFITTATTAAIAATAIVPVASAAVNQTEEVAQVKATQIQFPDVGVNHYASEAIYALKEKGIISGFPDGTFKPNEKLTRSQSALMFARALNLEIKPVSKDVFTDVKANHLYANQIAAIKEAGIFQGNNGRFGASDALTREQMASVIVRAFDLEPIPEKDVLFADESKISKSHYEAVKIIAQHGITVGKGDGTFDPKGEVTRAQFSAFLYRALELQSIQVDEKPIVIPKITEIISLNETNRYLKITFTEPIKSLDKSDITIVDPKSKDVYGVQSVQLSADGKVATVELYPNGDKHVLKENTQYEVNVKVNGTVITGLFYDTAFVEGRVININPEKSQIEVQTLDGKKLKVDIVTNDVINKSTFAYFDLLGETIRVWYDNDSKIVKYEVDTVDALFGSLELTKKDEVRLFDNKDSKGKKYDLSNKNFTLYVNGEKVATNEIPANLVNKGQKFNFVKVGLDKNGDVEFVSAYTLNDFLVVNDVNSKNEVIGLAGTPSYLFNADDAIIVKDGKAITAKELKKGDLLFFNQSVNNKEGFAVVYSNTVTGNIKKVYSDAIEVDKKEYNFIFNNNVVNEYSYGTNNLNYKNTLYLTHDNKLVKVDGHLAEELQKAGMVTLYLDPSGNVVLMTGNVANVSLSKQFAVLTKDIKFDVRYGEVSALLDVVSQDGVQSSQDVKLNDLESISVDGQKYKIKNQPKTRDEWVPSLTADGKHIVLTNGYNETKIFSVPTQGSTVKVNADGKKVKELELFVNNSVKVLNQIKPTDRYIGGKLITDSTIVFDATKGFDGKNVTTKSWNQFNDKNINSSIVVFNDKNEVVSITVLEAESTKQVNQLAYVTSVTKNTSGEVVRINAVVNGIESTYKVNNSKESISIGDVVMLSFGSNDLTVVEKISKETTDYVMKDLIIESVNLVDRTITLASGDTIQLLANGKVLDALKTSKGNLSLSDLYKENIKVKVVLDEKNSTFASLIVFEEITASEYLDLKTKQTPSLKAGFTDVDTDANEIQGEVIITSTGISNIQKIEVLLGDKVITPVNGKYIIAENTAFNGTDALIVKLTDGKNRVYSNTISVNDVVVVKPPAETPVDAPPAETPANEPATGSNP